MFGRKQRVLLVELIEDRLWNALTRDEQALLFVLEDYACWEERTFEETIKRLEQLRAERSILADLGT